MKTSSAVVITAHTLVRSKLQIKIYLTVNKEIIMTLYGMRYIYNQNTTGMTVLHLRVHTSSNSNVEVGHRKQQQEINFHGNL